MDPQAFLATVIIASLFCLSATAAMPVNPTQGMVWFVRKHIIYSVFKAETLSSPRILTPPVRLMLTVGFLSEVYFGLDPTNETGWNPKAPCMAWLGVTCDSDSSVTAM